jgi:chaperonin GroES
MNVRPQHDRILVKREEEEGSRAGSIIVADTAKEKPQKGKVIAVGLGKVGDGKRVALDAKSGDHILFGTYAGSDVKVDDDEYLILREEGVLAILE